MTEDVYDSSDDENDQNNDTSNPYQLSNAFLDKNLKSDKTANIADQPSAETLKLKSDHHRRPLYITAQGTIYLEAFNKLYEHARDFLVAIAEPICRPQFIHEFELSTYSLFTASAIGLKTEEIIKYLDLLCKTNLPPGITEFIRFCTASKGKVRLSVKNNRYFLESYYPEMIELLLKNPKIRECRDTREIAKIEEEDLENLKNPIAMSSSAIQNIGNSGKTDENDLKNGNISSSRKNIMMIDLLDDLDSAVENKEIELTRQKAVGFPILSEMVEQVQLECMHMDEIGPLCTEYDFRNDKNLSDMKIELRANAILRPYQETSLRKMFGNGRAKSGLVVLPCGAGKTLTGVTAVTTIRKPCIVLCTSSYAVEQWAHQFKLWTTATDEIIMKFTSDQKTQPSEKVKIVVTTYSMLGFSQKRSLEGESIMNWIKKREWGIMILDEVHTTPANQFRKILSQISCHCKLGLTATLVREDGKETDLYFLIGPKLYEANWLELQRDGHIARVQCAEVWCKMTPDFFRAYLNQEKNDAKQRLLYGLNPNKVRAAHYLIKYHENRGDKVIVFGDLIFSLLKYAKAFNKPVIYGDVSAKDRLKIFEDFKRDPKCSTIFISKVGDNSIDLPDANVLIQIASHGGSRRQEAQRLGRILRAKKNSAAALAISGSDYYNAYFYTLVSKDTKEMRFSIKRQRFLVNQGYSFKVVTELPDIDKDRDLYLTRKEDQTKLLESIENVDDNSADLMTEEEAMAGSGSSARKKAKMSISHKLILRDGLNEPKKKKVKAAQGPKSEFFKSFQKIRK